MKIDNTLINEVRNKVDIVEIISNHIPLTTRGKNYFGVCPFHDDHSPSMCVSKDRQIYTCFSCGATGNVFKFLQDFEHISFLEAVKKCADMCGIDIKISESHNDYGYRKNKELYEIYEISQKFYQNNLNSTVGKKAKEYLYQRGLTDNEIKEFAIGLSLSDYDILVKLLQKKNYSDKDLLKSGLVNANDRGLYDIYHNRIMFPLYDPFGHVIGYNGRDYTGKEPNRYINSKETELFKKRDFLYNYHRAKNIAREKKEIIIMEGPMDVIRAYTIGIENVVATLGSSFSPSHSNLIKRLACDVILCFDGDEAGLKATKLTIHELQKVNINPKIVRIPNNQDPDEFIKTNGKEAFIKLLSKAFNVMDFKEILLKKEINMDSAEGISNYIKSMISEINAIDDPILREVTVNKLVAETKVDKNIIMQQLEVKNNQVVIEPPKNNIKKNNIKRNKYEKSVMNLLYYMLHNPDVINIYEKKITHIPDDNFRHLAFQISAFYKQNGYINAADLLTEVRDDEETVKTIGLILALDLKKEYTKEEIEDYLNNIREYNDLERIHKYQKELSLASDINTKIELANKLIAYKLRSEEND